MMRYYFVLIVVISSAVLGDGKREKSPCIQKTEYFHPGKSYSFKYEVVAVGTATATANTPIGGTTIRCDVHLDADGNCQYTLKISKCILSDGYDKGSEHKHEKSEEFSAAVERFPIVFTISNGTTDGFQAHKEEILSILNFKRGIITSLITKKYPTNRDKLNDVRTEPRTDIHGTCPVKYSVENYSETNGSRMMVAMVKDMKKCEHPKKAYQQYNPFSLIWNTEFILRLFLSMEATCYYTYDNEKLDNINCEETYNTPIISTPGEIHSKANEITVQTNLKLTEESSSKIDKFDITSYVLHDIQYEFEKAPKSTQNPIDFENTVKSLVEKLTTDPEKPIHVHDAKAFDVLIDLLRKSSDLSSPNQHFGKVPLHPSKFTNLDIQQGQIWSDALIQCNRISCTRAFKAMLGGAPEFIKHIVGKSNLEVIFNAWRNAHIDEFDHVKEMLEIAKQYTHNRYIIYESSGILRNYWETIKDNNEFHHDDILQTEFHQMFKTFLSHVEKSFDEQCITKSGYKDIDVIAALKSLSKLMPIDDKISDKYVKVIENCVYSKKAHWFTGSVAMEVMMEMKPTPQFYNLLLKIFEDRTRTHVDRTSAYYFLAEKFGGVELVHKLLEFLANVGEKGYDYNLRTYILTHMRTLGKASYPYRTKYTYAIREAMVYNSSLLQAIPAEISPNKNVKKQDIPWGLKLDDDLIFEQGLFSKYSEEYYYYNSPIFKQLGYSVLKTSLYNEGNHLPFAKWYYLTLEGFGKYVTGFNVDLITKGMTKALEAIHFSEGLLMFPFSRELKLYLDNIPTIQQNIRESSPHFKYNVDSRILKTLTYLHKSRVQKIPKTDTKMEMIIQMGLFDNLIGLSTLDEILETRNRFSEKMFNKLIGPYPSSSKYWKFIEGSTTIPTLAGIAIEYTTDAYFINNVKIQMPKSEVDGINKPGISIDGSSVLVAAKQVMQFDLKEFTSFGIQYFSAISSSIGATVSVEQKSNPSSFTIQLELPQRPLQLLRLSRNISLIRDHREIDLHDNSAKLTTEDWCSYKPSSILGFKLCHKAYFVPASPENPCSSLAGNSLWEYTTDYIAKHKVAFQFGVQLKNEDDVNNKSHYEIVLKRRDEIIAEKFNTLVKLSHVVHKYQREFETMITAPILPTFNIKAKLEELPEKGIHFQAQATVYPGQTTYVDYMTKTSIEEKAESTIDHHLAEYIPSSNLVSVPTTETVFNYTSPTTYFGYNYKFQNFSKTRYADYKFEFKNPSDSKDWLLIIFHHPSFWNNDGTGWVKIRNEIKEAYEHQCYTHVKLPKTTVKFTAYNGPVSLNDQTLNFNLSRHNPITDKVLNFVQFASSAVHTTEDGKMSCVMKANITLPVTSLEVELRQDNVSLTNANYTFILRKEEPYLRDTGLPWWTITDVSEDIIGTEPKISSIHTNFRVSDNSPARSYLPFRILFFDSINLGMKEFYLSFIYHEDQRKKPTYGFDMQTVPDHGLENLNLHRRNFSISVPSENFRFDSMLTIAVNVNNSSPEFLRYEAKFGSPHDKTHYTFNMSQFPDGSSMDIIMDINSNTYKSNMHLMLPPIPTPSDIPIKINLDITSESQVEPLLDVNVTLRHDDKKTSMKMQNKFMIIDMDANNEDGYTNVINFNSKNLNLEPYMRWKINYPNDGQGTTMKIDLLDISKVFYIFAHTELDATRIIFHICHNENCTTSEPDSENFVTQIELSLENPEEITRTVTYNAELLNFVENLLRNQIIKGIQERQDSPAFETSPLNDAITTTKQTFKNVGRQTLLIFLPFTKQLILNLYGISDFVIQSITTVGKHYLSPGPIVHTRPSTFSWCTYGVKDLSLFSRCSGLGDRLKLNNWYTPGPIEGKSFVATTPLPVYWTHFNRFPIQLSPTFFGKLQKLKEKITSIGTARYRKNFQDENYTRHAFFLNLGDIYTFDGRIIHPIKHFLQCCSYLLSHDYQTQEFTIYYQNSMVHFLFPDLRLAIGSHGTVVIDETSQVELPFASRNENIRVTRQADLIEVNTPYHIKVICKIEPFYCIFYTNEHTMNKLIGFLGNNNYNPSDDTDDEVSYELSGETYCRKAKLQTPPIITDIFRNFDWHEMLWDDESPTLPCHGIISPTDFLLTQPLCHSEEYLGNKPLSDYNANISANGSISVQPSCDPEEYSGNIPVSTSDLLSCNNHGLKDGYLALCSAKNVPVGRSPLRRSYCRLRGHSWDLYWDSKVNDGLDVIFIIKLQFWKHPEQITNVVKKLADALVHQWQSVGQTNISFGLVGYEGKGYRHKPHQHTLNNKLLGTYDEFVNHGLRSLTFDGPNQHGEDAALAAVEHGVDYYTLREQSHHVFIMITPSEPWASQGPRIRKLVRNLLQASVTLHLFSDFELLKNDGYDFAQTKINKDLPKGVLTSLAAATKGSIWQISKLAESDDTSKEFSKIASTIYGNGEDRASKCRQCQCSFNSADQPMLHCEHELCEFTSKFNITYN